MKSMRIQRRQECDEAYRSLVSAINALVILNGETAYTSFIDNVNVAIDESKAKTLRPLNTEREESVHGEDTRDGVSAVYYLKNRNNPMGLLFSGASPAFYFANFTSKNVPTSQIQERNTCVIHLEQVTLCPIIKYVSMKEKKYYPRVCDKLISEKLTTLGALLIEGAKWCKDLCGTECREKRALYARP